MGPVSDNNNGTYSATYTAPTTSGTATISGTLNTATLPNATITLVPGAASQYLVTSSTAAPVAGAEVTITAQLADANSNAVSTSGLTVTWSSATTGEAGAFLAASSTTDASGIATVVFATSNTSGMDYTFTGTDGGNLTGTSGTITTQAGPASTTTSTIAADPTSITNTSGTSTITVQIKDAYGNNLTTGGATVLFTTTRSGSFSGETDNGDGTYTATYTTQLRSRTRAKVGRA